MFKKTKMLRAWLVGKLLCVKFKMTEDIESRGAYSDGTIYLKKEADAITVLHEIGHHLTGRGCCREHEEFMAHGVCIALAKFLGVYYGGIDRNMTSYATLECCPRAEGKTPPKTSK
jgi:hypothetical protein